MSILWCLKKLSKEMIKLIIINSIISGIASIFSSSTNMTDVFEKYPSTYEKDIEKSLQKAWLKVGNTLKENIDKYGSEIKKR
ncbi:hypothetical protein HMPREF3221_00266 [Fusobacterium nucleatum]|jgi:hypothetical protein|uniref:Uncharacterized protein n=2 Tax=Fusobacteriaceae TaxID=203492 RepID=A0A133PB38_FUSNU|nr:hypothetical protein HMPREF3221_00266 [Fusobacterium nucleatum]